MAFDPRIPELLTALTPAKIPSRLPNRSRRRDPPFGPMPFIPEESRITWVN